MNGKWDQFRAELADTRRSNEQRRHCRYCSAWTYSKYRVCRAHSDLLNLDAALEEATAPAHRLTEPPSPPTVPSPEPTVASSSAVNPSLLRTRGAAL